METFFDIFKTSPKIYIDKDENVNETIIKLRNKFISKFKNTEINKIEITYSPIFGKSNYNILLDNDIVYFTNLKKILELIDKLNRPYIIDDTDKSGDIYIRFVYGMNLKKIE
jgi:hypothetical protein